MMMIMMIGFLTIVGSQIFFFFMCLYRKLEKNWKEIRKEGLDLLNLKGNNLFKVESEKLTDVGDWRQLDLFIRGKNKKKSFSRSLGKRFDVIIWMVCV